MSSYIIKIIAIISMLFDHSGDALIGYVTPLNFIGRIAFPLFCFQLVIGYAHTRDVRKYCLRLFLFALISQIPFGIMIYNYTHNLFALNIFFTLFLGIFAMMLYDTDKLSKFKKTLAIIAVLLVAQFANVDYQAFGIILILTIHIFYNKGLFHSKDEANYKWYLPLLFILLMFILSVLKYLPSIKSFPVNYLLCLMLFTFLPTFIMLFYNGKKGPAVKYFFYAFYPIHLIVLDILHYFI